MVLLWIYAQEAQLSVVVLRLDGLAVRQHFKQNIWKHSQLGHLAVKLQLKAVGVKYHLLHLIAGHKYSNSDTWWFANIDSTYKGLMEIFLELP